MPLRTESKSASAFISKAIFPLYSSALFYDALHHRLLSGF